MIFKIAYQNKKQNRTSIKVVDANGKEIWMGCSDNVYTWCKKSFREGDEVDVTYTVNNNQYTATRVNKKGQSGSSVPNNAKQDTAKPEAGKSTGSSTAGKFDYPRDYMKSKNPEESKQIRALSILSSVCNAVQALAGQIDRNDIGEIIEILYDRCEKKLP